MNKICPSCDKPFDNRGTFCTRCYQKQYYEKNKEKKSLKKAQYYLDNKEEIDKKSKEYVAENHEKVKLKNRTHYKDNKEDILAYQKKYRITPTGKFGQGVKSAEERDLSWNIPFELYKSIIANPCHYCDEPLTNIGGSSLDRINNDVGYEVGNVLPCCGTCNGIRNRYLTQEEMEVAMKAVIQLRKAKDGQQTTDGQ